MSTNIYFMVYNAFGIGGTVKTIFNFADYFQKTGKYDVKILSIKKTRATPTLQINPQIKIIALQDARRGAEYSDEDRELLEQPSELIYHEEELYSMFNGYTDKKIREFLGSLHEGVLVTTMPSFNVLAATLVDNCVLKIGQEHKSYADYTPRIQELIRNNYGTLDALTILTERNRHIYERKIHGELPIYVLGNGTERLPYRANLKNHIIVAAGRYAEQKGFDLLIGAFAIIADEFPDWILKIYGEGTLATGYVKLIHKYNLEKQIVLEPGSERMNEKLSEASIHVCSSYYEPFGMVIIEGFAMGLPCISFACDGPREIITDGYDGIIVPREDVTALAEAMKKVMSDEVLRMELGANAYETAKKYDISVIGANLQKIVEKELSAKKIKIEEFEKSRVDSATYMLSAETYSQMITGAAEGKVGMKTIWKMIVGWMEYKLRRRRLSEE